MVSNLFWILCDFRNRYKIDDKYKVRQINNELKQKKCISLWRASIKIARGVEYHTLNKWDVGQI